MKYNKHTTKLKKIYPDKWTAQSTINMIVIFYSYREIKQVTSLCVVGCEVYIGTAWGCLVVAETWSLRPITVFRPYTSQLSAIVPLQSGNNTLVATFGTGYRPLIHR